MNKFLPIFFLNSLLSISCFAAEVSADIYAADSNHKLLGSVGFKDTPFGLLITPNLTALPTGLHGFHLHQHANCSDHAMAAGAHFDPQNTNTHQGPYSNGHLGDMPVLYVDAGGYARTTILSPRLKTSDLKGLAVMVHANGDNYSDTPALGGGGERIACGVIK
jgi:Cu-Zn family superoxide dismutase